MLNAFNKNEAHCPSSTVSNTGTCNKYVYKKYFIHDCRNVQEGKKARTVVAGLMSRKLSQISHSSSSSSKAKAKPTEVDEDEVDETTPLRSDSQTAAQVLGRSLAEESRHETSVVGAATAVGATAVEEGGTGTKGELEMQVGFFLDLFYHFPNRYFDELFFNRSQVRAEKMEVVVPLEIWTRRL